jgi:hypothetical protein
VEGRERKLDGEAKKVGRLCVHVRILSANFKEQAGRRQGFQHHVRDPREGENFGLLACEMDFRLSSTS